MAVDMAGAMANPTIVALVEGVWPAVEGTWLKYAIVQKLRKAFKDVQLDRLSGYDARIMAIGMITDHLSIAPEGVALLVDDEGALSAVFYHSTSWAHHRDIWDLGIVCSVNWKEVKPWVEW